MGWIIGGILLLIVVVVVIWFISSYNGFVRLKNMVEEAFATMDVYLKKRLDLIPNIVETVKGYAKHESETLEKVVEARDFVGGAVTPEQRMEGENRITGALKSLFAVAEAYPDLKANQNFMDLQGQLAQVENDIANSRRYYNAIVRDYNTKRETFPSVLVANLFHFEKRPLFEIVEEQRENIKVEF